VRAIASSRMPVLTGIGHEVDVSLADLAADQRAATPSNAAQLLVPDKREVLARVEQIEKRGQERILQRISDIKLQLKTARETMRREMRQSFERISRQFEHMEAILTHLNPKQALNRGYAIVRKNAEIMRSGRAVKTGDELSIELKDAIIKSGVTHVELKK